MKKKLLLITAIFLVLALVLPATTLAVPQVTLVEPSDARFVGGTANAISVRADSAVSTITSVEFQTFFSDPAGFPSMRIFAQTPISPVPAPRAGAAAQPDDTPSPAGLPATAVVSMTIFGTVTAVDIVTGEWQNSSGGCLRKRDYSATGSPGSGQSG